MSNIHARDQLFKSIEAFITSPGELPERLRAGLVFLAFVTKHQPDAEEIGESLWVELNSQVETALLALREENRSGLASIAPDLIAAVLAAYSGIQASPNNESG